ncbi:MAG: Calx-beta domain-containing protein, partial [Actinomycetota bacterium]
MKMRTIALAGTLAVVGLQLVPSPALAADTVAFSAETYSRAENASPASLTVQADSPVLSDSTVDYTTSDGSASAGSDYTAQSGTLIFSTGSITRTITVPLTDDPNIEGDETFTVTLSNATGDFTLDSPSTATVTIQDNDGGQTLAFNATNVTIGEGGGPAILTVTRSGGSTGNATVNYTSSPGTATSPSDYASTAGTLIFTAGETSENISVPITNDSATESDETFTVTLSSPNGAALGSPSASTVTIADDDAPQVIALSSATTSVTESGGPLILTVTRSGGTTGVATVNYATSNGSASAGSDYTNTSDTLIFTAGETSENISVPITNDTATESNETFTVTLSSPTGASLGTPSSSTVTIVDDDGTTAVLGFSASAYSVDEDGGSVTITVKRSGSETGSKSVNYATSDGSAAAGSDYTATSGTLTFTDPDTSMTFVVPISDDPSVEGDETVTLALSGATNGAVLGTTPATLTIADDDQALVSHDRSVGLRLRRHLRAKGTVTVPDGTPSCYVRVPVAIQRKRSGVWRTIARIATDDQGDYRTRIPDKTGRY